MKNRRKVMRKHFRKTFGRAKEEAYQYIEDDINKALERSKLMLSIDDEAVSAPIIIKSANTDNPKTKYRVVRFKDKTEATRVDYSESLLVTLYLGKNSMFFHEAVVDHMHGFVLEDYAVEVKYNDVVQVETFVDYNPRVNMTGLSTVHLILNLVNGTKISLNLRNHYMHSGKDSTELLTKDERKIISTIKKALRTGK